MEIILAVAVLAPLVLFFVLTLALTVHFFWLSHRGRWPPGLPPQEVGEPPATPVGQLTGADVWRRRCRLAEGNGEMRPDALVFFGTTGDLAHKKVFRPSTR